MRNIVATFVKYPFYANIIIMILLFAGIPSFLNMKMSFFPERASRDIVVTVAYPGASPKQMEEGITTRIEEAVRGIVGIKEINSTSSENFTNVRITTTGEYDLDETLMEVKNAVDGISSFPTAAEKPIVYKVRNTSRAMFLGLSGDVDLMTLKKYADQVEEDLLNSGVVSQVQVSGYPPIEISIEATEEDLLRYKLTFDEIERAVSLNNQDISGGMIKSPEQEILIRSRQRSVDPDKIGEIILRANNDGSFLRIRDVAEVKMKFADVPADFTMNGKQAVSFAILKLTEEDLSEISAWMHDYIDEFNAENTGVHLEITFDFLSVLYERLQLLYSNGGIGLLLVIIALTLFLSTRLSFWVAAGIPFSFLAMAILAVFYGITINMISLFGMILVIGILVDDGIVIGENIFTHFESGKSPMRAALDGTMEVLPAVVTSISTTIIAFSPLLVLEGRMEFMFEMAFVVIFSLFFSLAEAFFVLPAHLASPHVLRRRNKTNKNMKVRDYLDRVIAYMREKIYGRMLHLIVRWRWIAVSIPIALILITAGLLGGGFIQATFFPSIPFDSFNISIAFTPGSGEKQTREYVERFDDIVWEVNNELMEKYGDTLSYVSHTFASVGSAFSGQENGSHAGQVEVFFNSMEDRPISTFDVADVVRERIGEVPEAEKFTVGGMNRWGSPVSISLLGKNLEELRHAKAFMIGRMEELPTLKNITDNNAIGKQEIRLDLKPKAYFLGMNHASISQQVRQGFYGGQAQRLQYGRDEVRVWVRYPKTDRQTVGQLEDMKIKTPQGDFPLSELVNYDIERGPVSIKRFNSQREVRVDADLTDPYAPVPPILEQIQNEIIPEMQAQYPGVRIMYQGQQRDSEESTEEMRKYYGVAFAIIILILMIHFKAIGHAFIVILMIPLAWIGAAWGHGIEGIPVSMLSAWGMVALSGVIVNDAVVFLAKYNTFLLEGQKVPEAAYNAGIARFRAIVLTTITTTIGLYPLILEKSFQAQFLIPMAVSLAYGVLIGTGFILVFFPALILVLNDIKRSLKWLWTGQKPTAEEVETAIIDSKRKIQ